MRLAGNVFENFDMFSSSEEELEEPLRHRVIRQPRNFEERWFDIENPGEFREKSRLSVEAFEYLLAAVGPTA